MADTSSLLIDLKVAPDGTYIIARMIGEHTIAMAIDSISQLRVFIGATGLMKVLIEAPDQRQMFDVLPSYELATAIEAAAVPRCQFAIVVTMSLWETRFLETVLVDRHIAVRYFNTYDMAVAWLGVVSDRQ